jgi:hypothetical protein
MLPEIWEFPKEHFTGRLRSIRSWSRRACRKMIVALKVLLSNKEVKISSL